MKNKKNKIENVKLFPKLLRLLHYISLAKKVCFSFRSQNVESAGLWRGPESAILKLKYFESFLITILDSNVLREFHTSKILFRFVRTFSFISLSLAVGII